MRFSRPTGSGFAIRPLVTLTIVYLGACTIWFLWLLLTARYPEAGSGEEARLVGDGALLGTSVLNVLLLMLLGADAARVRRGPPDLRRGHLAGVLLAGLGLLLLELALLYAHAPLSSV